MAKQKEKTPLKELVKKLQQRGEELLSKMTEEEIQREQEASKDLLDRMHWEHFGFLDGQEPPEGLEER